MSDYKGYLFVHFTGEHPTGEQIYFSISRDGLHWHDLNGGEPILWSKIGEMGVRDPYIIRSPFHGEGKPKYFLIATDLRIANGKGWGTAQYGGSRDIIVWESDDLINWSEPEAHTVGIPGAGCVWAPECVYDEEKDAILVFWASMTKFPGDEHHKQRIFASYTRDFKTFTEPELYIERENHVIDTTIIKDDKGYYRYSKDETTKNIRVDFSKTLDAGTFVDVRSSVLDSIYGVEGPEIFKFNDRDEWCLIVDRFATGRGYMPLITDDLSSGNFKVLDDSEFNMGKTLKRHGGIINITEEEYLALEKLM